MLDEMSERVFDFVFQKYGKFFEESISQKHFFKPKPLIFKE